MSNRRRLATLRARGEDALREIGTLLLAFGPLDAALEYERGTPGTWRAAIGFFLLGATFFGFGLLLEWRRGDAE